MSHLETTSYLFTLWDTMRRATKTKLLTAIVVAIIVCFIISWKIASSADDMIRMESHANHQTSFPVQNVQVTDFQSCTRIISGENDAIILAINHGGFDDFHVISPTTYLTYLTRGCMYFANKRGYILNYLTEEECNFPIAYSILFYNSFHQMEMLLRAIYRPQNFYCLHLDQLSSPIMHKVVKLLSHCFENIVLPKENIDVVLGRISVLTPEILCMKALMKYKGWRYFINLSGEEMPLKTNRQIVKILKSFKGRNDVDTAEMTSDFRRRWDQYGPPPHNLTLYKGATHVSLSRLAVEFIIKDHRVADLLKYLGKTRHPAESFFTTVNNNPSLNAPGGFRGSYNESRKRPWMTRYRMWTWHNKTCHGKFDASSCILGVGDLQYLTRAPQLFANKFQWQFEPLALRCMHEWLYNRTRDEYRRGFDRSFNASFYYHLYDIRPPRRMTNVDVMRNVRHRNNVL